MDHSNNDLRFYVYIHKDKISGEIKYVGSGAGARYSNIADRSDEHINAWVTLDKIILVNNMSRESARKYEALMITRLSVTGSLFNKDSEVHEVKSIEHSSLSEYICYDESSPTFLRWIKQPLRSDGLINRRIKVGMVAGSICDRTKYVNVKFLGTTLKGHRVVYSLCNQVDVPKNFVVDHIDRNRTNNNKNNLRLVTYLENNRNSSVYRSNTSGITGVAWSKSEGGGYWVAYYNIEFRRKTKNFNPRTLYPDLPPEEAKQNAFEDAVEWRKQMEHLHYNKQEQ